MNDVDKCVVLNYDVFHSCFIFYSVLNDEDESYQNYMYSAYA